jgi:hypothetical protein
VHSWAGICSAAVLGGICTAEVAFALLRQLVGICTVRTAFALLGTGGHFIVKIVFALLLEWVAFPLFESKGGIWTIAATGWHLHCCGTGGHLYC